MPTPDLVVEIAWGDTYKTVTKTWVNVSAYVRGVTIDGPGRDNEWGITQPGTATVLLDNITRRFEPGYTSGAYSPNVKPLVPIRISTIHNSITYRLYSGFVRGWPLSYPADGTDAIVTIECVDATAMLSRRDFDTYRELVVSDGAVAHWPFDDKTGAGFADVAGAHGGTWTTLGALTVYQSLAFGPGDDPRGIILADGSFEAVGQVSGARELGITGDLTIELWAKAKTQFDYTVIASASDQNATNTVVPWQLGYIGIVSTSLGNATLAYSLAWNVTGDVTGELPISQSYDQNWVLSAPADDTAAHIVMVRNIAEQRVRGYVNGVQVIVNPIASTGWVAPTINANVSAGLGRWGTGIPVGLTGIQLSHLAVYPRALAEDEIVSHYVAAYDRVPSEATQLRLGRILDAAGWPTGASYRNLDTGIETLDASVIHGSTRFLDHIRAVEVAEGGQFWIDGAGVAQFRDRQDRAQNQMTSQILFGDAGGSERPYKPTLNPSMDDSFLYNIVRVRHAGGGEVIAEDVTSQDAFWPSTLTLSLGLSTAADAQELADWSVSRYKDPRLRTPGIEVQPERNQSVMWPLILNLTIGERVTLTHRPPGGGTARTADQFVERINHVITPEDWLVQMQLSPVENFQMWVLENSEYGKLGSYPVGY